MDLHEMSSSQRSNPRSSPGSKRWIESLADQERSIFLGERLSFDLGLTKEQVVQEETLRFLEEICQHFSSLSEAFNSRISDEDALKLAVSSPELTQTVFWVSRKDMRLDVCANYHGVIKFQAHRRTDPTLSWSRASLLFTGQVEVTFGPFNEVSWLLLGNEVSAEQIAQHYLTEFIQISRS